MANLPGPGDSVTDLDMYADDLMVDVDFIRGLLDEAESIWMSAGATIARTAMDLIFSAETQSGVVASRILGGTDAELDQVENILAKLAQKVRSRITTVLSEAYSYWVQLGGSIPSDTEIEQYMAPLALGGSRGDYSDPADQGMPAGIDQYASPPSTSEGERCTTTLQGQSTVTVCHSKGDTVAECCDSPPKQSSPASKPAGSTPPMASTESGSRSYFPTADSLGRELMRLAAANNPTTTPRQILSDGWPIEVGEDYLDLPLARWQDVLYLQDACGNVRECKDPQIYGSNVITCDGDGWAAIPGLLQSDTMECAPSNAPTAGIGHQRPDVPPGPENFGLGNYSVCPGCEPPPPPPSEAECCPPIVSVDPKISVTVNQAGEARKTPAQAGRDLPQLKFTFDFNSPNICAQMDAFESASEHYGTLSGLFKAPADTKWKIADVGQSWMTPLRTVEDTIAWGFLKVVSAGSAVMNDLVYELTAGTAGTIDRRSLESAGMAWLYNFASKWVGLETPFVTVPLSYHANFHTPYLIPTQPQVDQLYLSGRVPQNTWECLTRMNGSLPYWAGQVRDANATLLTAADYQFLMRRKVITEQQRDQYIRRLGHTDPMSTVYLDRLTEALPTMPDVIRFMVRDVADEATVMKYGYDTDFDTKFSGQLGSWLTAQGYPLEVAKYFWRAHWTIPSSTQLYEMLHRLRPNRKEGFVPAMVVTTPEDAREALMVNDNAPGWVDRLMAISYLPINRTDALRAFEIDAFTSDRLQDAYQDLGYSEPDAIELVRFARIQKRRRMTTSVYGGNASRFVKKYVNGHYTLGELQNRLDRLGFGPELIEIALQRAQDERTEHLRDRGLKALRTQRKKGEISKARFEDELTRLGFTPEFVIAESAAMEFEVAARFKTITASQLCKMYKNNLIDGYTYWVRLTHLGYSETDAELMVGQCQIDLNKEIAKRIEAESRRAKAEKDKRDKELARQREKLDQLEIDRIRAERCLPKSRGRKAITAGSTDGDRVG